MVQFTVINARTGAAVCRFDAAGAVTRLGGALFKQDMWLVEADAALSLSRTRVDAWAGSGSVHR